MKKSNLIITIAVVIVLAASSVGAILAASGVFAAGTSPVTNTTGRITFDSPYGIRWNEGKSKGDGSNDVGVFEVFNTAGFSWIASDWHVNATGDVQEGAAAGFYPMSHTATYHVMQDIVYEDTPQLRAAFKTGAPNFGSESEMTGLIDGRGYTLYDFPVRGATTLYSNIYGSIKNLAIDAKGSRSVLETFSGLFGVNLYGKIINCQSRGSIVLSNATDRFTGGFVGLTSGASIIANCVNYADITILNGSNWANAGGIAGRLQGGSVYGCVNYGCIMAPRAGGLTGTISAVNNNVYVERFVNYGDIGHIKSYHAAGVCAWVEGVSESIVFVSCYNGGDVTANSTEGIATGIAGVRDILQMKTSFSLCVNRGSVAADIVGEITQYSIDEE